MIFHRLLAPRRLATRMAIFFGLGSRNTENELEVFGLLCYYYPLNFWAYKAETRPKVEFTILTEKSRLCLSRQVGSLVAEIRLLRDCILLVPGSIVI